MILLSVSRPPFVSSFFFQIQANTRTQLHKLELARVGCYGYSLVSLGPGARIARIFLVTTWYVGTVRAYP
jgi:hypothetical protein